jgi:hypothetical protein
MRAQQNARQLGRGSGRLVAIFVHAVLKIRRGPRDEVAVANSLLKVRVLVDPPGQLLHDPAQELEPHRHTRG